MSKINLFSFLIIAIFAVSCSTNDDENKNVESTEIDSTKIEVKEEPTPEQVIRETAKKDKSVDVDFKENKKEIEKVYGEQWDFCHCVVVNDSIDKAVKAGNFDDKLMKRFDEVDLKCKAFLVMDNSRTPEQRMLHEKKIKKCLREAGVR